jgi:hypothetical protein
MPIQPSIKTLNMWAAYHILQSLENNFQILAVRPFRNFRLPSSNTNPKPNYAVAGEAAQSDFPLRACL